jgi:hypothetical protein
VEGEAKPGKGYKRREGVEEGEEKEKERRKKEAEQEVGGEGNAREGGGYMHIHGRRVRKQMVCRVRRGLEREQGGKRAVCTPKIGKESSKWRGGGRPWAHDAGICKCTNGGVRGLFTVWVNAYAWGSMF